MLNILAIDPGSKESGLVRLDATQLVDFKKIDNEKLLFGLNGPTTNFLVIETMEYVSGGKETVDTLLWAGRFYERWEGKRAFVSRQEVCREFGIKQKTRKKQRAKLKALGRENEIIKSRDSQIITKMQEIYGPKKIKTAQERTHKRTGKPLPPKQITIDGPTANIGKDMWAALAVATFAARRLV